MTNPELYWTTQKGMDLLTKVAAYFTASAGEQSSCVLKCKRDLLKEGVGGDLVTQAIEICLSRLKLLELGCCAELEQGLFTTTSLEQCTCPAIAAHHAVKFKGCSDVLEICSGAAFDTAAIAKVAKQVTCIESDTALASFARHNLQLQGITNVRIIEGRAEDLISTLAIISFDGVWCDPSRRDAQGRRVSRPEDYSPALNFLLELKALGIIGIKISPGLNLNELASGWSREWIGFKGECLEQVLWHGASLADGTVSLIDNGITWVPGKTKATCCGVIDPSSLPPVHFIVEPHAALIRCGHLEEFFLEHNFCLIDSKIAYGISRTKPASSVFYSVFEVIDKFPFDLKILNGRIKELGWDSMTEIKKRGFPEEPDEVRRKLSFPPKQNRESQVGTIILTRAAEAHWIFLCRRC